jgi:hypothetical protein
MTSKVRALLLVLLSLACAPHLFAWGEAGHLIVNEAASYGLPNDMPPFFYAAMNELTWLGPEPDRWKTTGVSLDAANTPDHYLDYEYVDGLKLPADRYRFIDLLYQSGTLRRHGIYNSTAGFLPWRIAELADKLTTEFRMWRNAPPNSFERKYIELQVASIAGVLGHFVGDSSNPHHATTNFNGWVDPNPNGYAYDCETHDRFERYFVAQNITTGDVTPRLSKPVLRSDYFATAIEFVRQSNSLVEPLYQLDKTGAFDLFRKPVSPEGKAFAADRLAAGASMLRDFWWSAWVNSAKPPKRGSGE